MADNPIKTERRGAVLEVVLDRPKANAIDLATSRIMGEVFRDFRDDPALRVAVLTASGEKFFWFEHAERNAIYNAARVGMSLKDCTIYVNRFPCADCTRAIIQAGIGKICCPAKPEFDGALDHSFDVSEVLLAEAGVEFTVL